MNYKVKIHKLYDNSDKYLKAQASVTLDNKIVIHGVRVMESPKGRFVAMPQNTVKDKDGKDLRRDVAHPISTEARAELEKAVFDAYEAALKEANSTNK